MTFRKSYLICFALALLILVSPQKRANSAELPGSMHITGETEGGLEFDIVPYYIWLAGIDGTVGVGPVTAKIDITPWDYIENLGIEAVKSERLDDEKSKFHIPSKHRTRSGLINPARPCSWRGNT